MLCAVGEVWQDQNFILGHAGLEGGDLQERGRPLELANFAADIFPEAN